MRQEKAGDKSDQTRLSGETELKERESNNASDYNDSGEAETQISNQRRKDKAVGTATGRNT